MRNWLFELRKSANKSQSDIAKEAGISRSFYTRIENDNRRPSYEVAKKIATAIDNPTVWPKFFDEEAS